MSVLSADKVNELVDYITTMEDTTFVYLVDPNQTLFSIISKIPNTRMITFCGVESNSKVVFSTKRYDSKTFEMFKDLLHNNNMTDMVLLQ